MLLGSYFFYGWWDWRFLFLLIGVSALNFYLGIKISKSSSDKWSRIYLNIGLFQGIGGLVYFKYFNFFITSFKQSFAAFGMNLDIHTLNIILPLGISFFTFRTISYLVDVENGKTEACTDALTFFNYVSFFPSLLSGPIDKARDFIPQLEKKRVFKYETGVDGLKQILWGLFKKLVIADNCGRIVNQVFANFELMPSSSLWLGMFLYGVQLYTDFSGYSDMAIGISRLLGFDIYKNFDFPFFAQSIPEYWRKWHISLTSWLTEYVFTPLSFQFRKYGKLGVILAIIINFVICGIWHGANWTYVLYGFVHGLFFIPAILNDTFNKNRKTDLNRNFPTLTELFNILTTFIPVLFTFILFKSESVSQAFKYYAKMFSGNFLSAPVTVPIYVYGLILYFFLIEYKGRGQDYAIKNTFAKFPIVFRLLFYFFLITTIFLFSASEQQFIYFQF
ncbi:MAG TPA: MBOAT family O-acyltransferase [Flavobacterium sp.]|uniref:MBOAT family O-acyltransferase n=1 Tax=Flavobacterium sp. TaxID=239 RepID=UPI002CD2A5AB|nr:MBOAT family O-acyltransferase [Flavobacterium sp.]HNP33128.1 MBOAT family O-acyltransferase [Flavobacterium sp.]